MSEPNNSSILVVDDNADNRELLSDLFAGELFNVVCVDSVANARAALLKPGRPFDLVLSDISMPEETGFDLLAWRAKQDKGIQEIPVLLITAALPEDEYRVRGLSMGAVDYVIRPISNQELLLRVHIAIDNYRRYASLKTTFESSQDLVMVGRFLAAANHEIRNLSTLILMTSEQVVRVFKQPGGPESDVGQKALRSLEKSSRLLADLSRSLNEFVGHQKTIPRPVNLVGVIRDIMDLVAVKARSVKIAFDPDPTREIWAQIDEMRFKQIMINFLLNAIDSIGQARNSSVGYIDIRVTESGPGHWQVRVTDDGVGLSKRETLSEFQPFVTTKAVRGGKGLGLWWSSQLALAMDGRVEITSGGPGMGATSILTVKKASKEVEDNIDLHQYLN